MLPPFTDLRVGADAGRRRPAVDQVRRPGRLRARRPARTPARSRRACWPSSAARYVVVGHSERREYHAETDAVVNAKAHKALAAGMTPIVCVGEGLEIRQAGDARRVHAGAGRRLARRASPPSRSPAWSSPTSRCGRSAPARWRPRRTRRRSARRSGRGSREVARRRRGGRRTHPVRRLGEGRERRRDHGAARRRRLPGGRRQPAGGRVRRHLPVLRHADHLIPDPDVGCPTVTLLFTIMLMICQRV